MTGQAAKAKAAKAHNHDDVYDRQIRLWGAEAQKRMSTARVLYVNLSGVSCEMLKNLILAGVAAVICDGRAYPEAVRELPSSFFGAEEMEKIINEVHDVSNDDGGETKVDEVLTKEQRCQRRAQHNFWSCEWQYKEKVDSTTAPKLVARERHCNERAEHS